jgi:hypothetical protein
VQVEAGRRRTQTGLAHPLYGEVLRNRLRRSRARQVYRDLAGELVDAEAMLSDALAVFRTSDTFRLTR